MLKITIGCDPEVFATKNGKFRSAHGLVPGTKEEPYRVENGAVQVDGMALEYNIDPVDNVEDFVHFNQSVLAQLKAMLPKYELAVTPACKFNGNHFRRQPDEAKMLGCTPDFNAYTLKENPIPDNKTTLRTASGHIHVGFCEDADITSRDHMVRCATLVKQLDMYLGLPSVLFDPDTTRRKMYGLAGAFRPKPYGVEYRVLSNAWLLSEERMRFVFNQTITAVNDLIKGIRPFESERDQIVRRFINNSQRGYARDLILRCLPNGDQIIKQASVL